jgi:signal peptidase II
MFYFPILEGNYPQWLPFLGGDSFIFFRPVFNVADSAITSGVIYLLLFQRQFFHSQDEKTDLGHDSTHEDLSVKSTDNTLPADENS